MSRRALLGAFVTVATLAGLLARRNATAPERVPAAAPADRATTRLDTDAMQHRESVAAALREAAAVAPLAWPPPQSLRDTEQDGALGVDADGHLLVNAELRRFFEYWAAASGEEPDGRLRARLTAAIHARLDGVAEAEALAMLERFDTYRERGRELAERGDAPAELAARAEAVRQLRREMFGERDAAALFGDDEALVAAVLAERRISADTSLSEQQRAEQLAAVDAGLPESIRATRRATTEPQRLARDEAALRMQGGSPEAIQALRAERVGEQAAARLAALDAQRAAWQERLASYRAARAGIDADRALDESQRQTAIAALRAQHFSGPELLRVDALDALEP